MSSKKLVAVGIIALIVIIVLILFVAPVVTSSPAAVLKIEQGSVVVNEKPASSGMTLKEGDTIATGQNSKASIILYGASSVRLAEMTMVEIAELSNGRFRLIQRSGSTWNKVTQLSGLESYEVETPNAKVGTQGTTFGCRIIVTSGMVDSVFKTKTECGVVENTIIMYADEGVVMPILEGQTGTVEFENDEKIIIGNVQFDDVWIQENLAKDDEFVKDIKSRIISKYAVYIPLIKSQYGLSDAQLDQMLDGFLTGKYSNEQYEAALAELKSKGIEIKL